VQAQISFNPVAPAAAFADSSFSDLFFKTTECLRADKSSCYPPGNTYYDITHHGLDAMMQRYMQEIDILNKVPDEFLWPNHTR
jgi:hypothetical protein